LSEATPPVASSKIILDPEGVPSDFAVEIDGYGVFGFEVDATPVGVEKAHASRVPEVFAALDLRLMGATPVGVGERFRVAPRLMNASNSRSGGVGFVSR